MGATITIYPDAIKKTMRVVGVVARMETVTVSIPNATIFDGIADLRLAVYYKKVKVAESDYFIPDGVDGIAAILNMATQDVIDAFDGKDVDAERFMKCQLWSDSDSWLVFTGEISVLNNLSYLEDEPTEPESNDLFLRKSMVVDNTSNTATDLPLSARVGKILNDSLQSKASTSVVTTSANGLMSYTDKIRLNGIENNAQKNSNITKSEIEAKLTGIIDSHSHEGLGTGGGTASTTTVDSTGFTGNLSTDIETVQDALDEIDALDLGSELWPVQVLTDCAMFDEYEGRYTRLDDEIATVKTYNGVRRIKKMILSVITGDPLVTGNVVIVPTVAGVAGTAIILPVTATLTEHVLDLTGNGIVSLTRDHTNELDTLKDGVDVVSVLIKEFTLLQEELI